MSVPGTPVQVAAGDLGLLRRPTAGALATMVAAGLTLLAVVLWSTSLAAIDQRRISDVGLITALPVASLVAPVVLAASFILALNSRPLREPLLALNVVLLVLMLHGTTSLIQEVPRIATTYVHAGFIEAIMRTGDLFVNRDARFSWPLFFVLGAYLTSIAGFDNPIHLTDWIPAISNLLYLVPLFLIFRAFTVDRRAIWLGVWIFVAANWVGQDYFSPQGFNILLYLTILAILLTWFRSSETTPFSGLAVRIRRLIRSPYPEGAAEADEAHGPALTAGARAGLVLVLVLLLVVDVASHQLTPFALLTATGILVVTRRTVLRGFPILVGVLLGTWLSYMTLAFLAGHINGLLAETLQAEAVLTSTVGNRLRGNAGHLFVVFERIAFSAAFWGIAFLGGLRRFWNGHWDLSVAMLAGFPFLFLGLQSYGGEMLLRVYLFALPFMCFFVAGLFYPQLKSGSRWQPVLLLGLSGVLVVAFFFARFGNDRADAFTADELAAVDRASALMPAGSVLVSANHNSPLGYRDYDRFDRFVGVDFTTFTVDQIANAISRAADGRRAFVFLSDSQRSYYDLNGFPGADWDAMLREFETSPRFHLVFETRDTVLYELVGAATVRAP